MKIKRNKIILLLSAALLVGMLAILLSRTKEPAYHGKTLTEWTEQFRDVVRPLNFDPHSEKLSTSQQAIQTIGRDAVPFYVKWIQAKNSPLQVKLCNLLENQPLIAFHFRTAEDKHDLAQYGFIALGHDAGKTAIPKLLKLTESQDNELQHRVLSRYAKVF